MAKSYIGRLTTIAGIAALTCVSAPAFVRIRQLQEVHIDSSAEQKKKALKSFLFETVDELYPGGRIDNSKLSHKVLQKIAKDYKRQLDNDVNLTRKYYAQLENYLNLPLEFSHFPSVMISTDDAISACSDSQHIIISVALLRANLAAAVDDSKVLSVAPSDKERLVASLFRLRDEIKRAPASKSATAIIDLESGTDELEDLWD